MHSVFKRPTLPPFDHILQSISKLTEMKKKVTDLNKTFAEESEHGREMITQYVSDGIDVMSDKIQQIEVLRGLEITLRYLHSGTCFHFCLPLYLC
jgi:hypothetical protein